jgi:hypothetical protein
MIKGLAITPILGRISIGKVVEKNGKRCLKRMTNLPLPVKSKVRRDGSNIHLMNSYEPKHKIKNSNHSRDDL